MVIQGSSWRYGSEPLRAGYYRRIDSPFPTIAGLSVPKAFLAQAASSGQCHHALLLHGPAGIGKLALALSYAKALMNGSMAPDESNPDAHLIRLGNHPDVTVFARTRELLAEEARELEGQIARSPQRGPKRLVILDGAEQFNPSVANLLLKTLEEPPSWGQFILLTSSPDQLLPTIRSRTLPVPCREAPVAAILADLAPYFDAETQRRFAEVAPLVGGRVGDLLRLTLLPGYAALQGEISAFGERVLRATTSDLFDLEGLLAALYERWDAVQAEESLPAGADLAELARWAQDPASAPRYVNFHPEETAPPASTRQQRFLELVARFALAQFHRHEHWRGARGQNFLEALRRAPRRMEWNANWSMVLEGVLLETFGFDCGAVQSA